MNIVNVFLQNPIKIVVYDPVKNISRRAFVFLGDVPKGIWNACNYYHTVTAQQRIAYDKLLHDFYGTDFKTKLGLNIKDPKLAWIIDSKIEGGDEYSEKGSVLYDLECAFQFADKTIIQVDVSQMEWILKEMPRGYFEEEYEIMRLKNADLNAPILIVRENERIIVIDGIHRLKNAVELNVKSLPTREISQENLAKCRCSKNGNLLPICSVFGSGEDTEADLSEIEELLKTPAISNDKHENPSSKKLISSNLRANFELGIEYVTDVQIYPEDKFGELKDKIFITTNIPNYRQHLFYISHGKITTTYRISAEGLYNVDIRSTFYNSARDNVYGIPIDKNLYELRDAIKIDALDMFTILSGEDIKDNTIYVVDLAQFTEKIGSDLHEIARDTYQFDLIYNGFILKYFPQLTRECLFDYLINESELYHKYPDLARSKNVLTSIYKHEREIINLHYKNLHKSFSQLQDSVSIAITQMIAVVTGSRVMLNIRNLFDKLRVTKCIPEIHAYFDHDHKKYMVRKRHVRNESDIQFPSGSLMKNGITIAISLRKSDQETFHSRSGISTMENEQSRYMFLNIWSNGKYHIKTVWNEEDERDFDEIVKLMKKFIDPIIGGINNLGKYVFSAGSSLPLISKQNISYQGLNICIFWKKVMLENTFKIIKSLWDPYMRARITGQRNVQQFDKYEFLFRKGMYEFDTTAIERIVTTSNNIILLNQYGHLSSSIIKQKWDQNYDGRIVRMSHRTTDVRFEVSDIREREFSTFYRYIMTYIYNCLLDNNVKTSMMTQKNYKDIKKLRKLREQDPELFNLKKYGSKKVYSIVCQNQRQPLIFTPDEIKSMQPAEIKKLTQYWNFTLNKPAYYGCPNKKYPHLSFMINSHPKHYCLPCCNKKPSIEEYSKKNKINTICMQKHKFISGPANLDVDTISRHIMNYGKDIDLGRLSKLPQSSIKNLLFGTLQVNSATNYYLYGVPQHLPGIENIGIIYAIAEAIELPMEKLIEKLILELKRSPKMLFNTLLNGTLIEYFRDMDHFIITIKELFIDVKMFSTNIQKFRQWPELIIELCHVILQVSVLTFIDENGTGEVINLFVSNSIKNEIIYMGKLLGSEKTEKLTNDPTLSGVVGDQTYILILKKQNKYYPIFIIDAEKYFKNLEIDTRLFHRVSNVIKLIYSMVKHGVKSDELVINKSLDLSLVKAFTSIHSKYMIKIKYINKQNLCYGLLLMDPDKNFIYVPIGYSTYIADSIEISFDAFDPKKIELRLDCLLSFIDSINLYIGETQKIQNVYLYKPLTQNKYYKLDTELISMDVGGFMFYFNKYTQDLIDSKLDIEIIKYDYAEINKMILSRAVAKIDARTQKIGEALYNNYAYQLFIIEFVNFLNNERNTQIRSGIIMLIDKTNFKKDTNDFRKNLRNLLKEFSTDYTVIQSQMSAFYQGKLDKPQLLLNIDKTTYDFDRLTISKLKALSSIELKNELKRISKNFVVEKDFDTTGVKFPNIYLPCEDLADKPTYCDNKKLILTKNNSLDIFIDILAKDLSDDLKLKYILNNLMMDITIDMFSFQRNPNEIITIYRLSN